MSDVIDLESIRHGSRGRLSTARKHYRNLDHVTDEIDRMIDGLVDACVAADSFEPSHRNAWINAVCQSLNIRHERETSF